MLLLGRTGATWAPQLDRVPSGEDTVLDVSKSTQHRGAFKHRERQDHRASAAPKEMEPSGDKCLTKPALIICSNQTGHVLALGTLAMRAESG